jgi:hypothetical protein
VTRASRLAGALFAGLFVAFHLPFLPSSLEDLDSINFALGVRDYDMSRHQPHPPGYPVFIAAAKVLRSVGLSEVHALSLVNIVSGAAAIFGLLMFFGVLDRDRTRTRDRSVDVYTWMAALLALVSPLYWITAARPLSDAAGLSAAVAIQGATLLAPGPGSLAMVAGLAGAAAGIRSQVIWLTVPLLALAAARLPRAAGVRARAAVAAAYVAGALLWAVPLVLVSGGLAAYGRAFFSQGAEDLAGVTLLATRPSRRLLVDTLAYSFIDPWGHWALAGVLLVLAGLGAAVLLRRARGVAVTMAVAFGPYLVFHLLFQEAVTTRYALPLIVPAAYLAVRGMSLLPKTPALAIGLALGAGSIFVDAQAMYGYASMDAPAFRMLGDMGAVPRNTGPAPVLAMHRRADFDLRRPIAWSRETLPAFARRLPAPPKHEWLELVKYWNDGGRAPVWFVADPLRTDLALLKYHGGPSRYRWPFAFTGLIGGARPNEVDWHTIQAPDWYLGEGWALTPETAGTANEDRRGPGLGGISGWVRRRPGPMTLMIGGRNLSAVSAALRVALDGQAVDETTVPPGFFLRMARVSAPPGNADYMHLSVASDAADLAIEQFDAQPAGRVVYGFGEGWNELEANPSNGTLWRWSTDRAVLRARAEGRALALTLRGEIEEASSSRVTIRVGQDTAEAFDVGRSFTRTLVLPAGLFAGDEESVITIETSAWYVPAEKRGRTADRRRLGLKLYECRVTPAS